jgi:hypothetical protein
MTAASMPLPSRDTKRSSTHSLVRSGWCSWLVVASHRKQDVMMSMIRKGPFQLGATTNQLISHLTAHRLFAAPRVSWPGLCALYLLVLNAVILLGFTFRDIILDATCHRWISRFVQGIGERSWRKSICGQSLHVMSAYLHYHNTHERYIKRTNTLAYAEFNYMPAPVIRPGTGRVPPRRVPPPG